MNAVSANSLAKLLLLTPRRVRALASDGVIPKLEHGLYPVIGSIRGYFRFLVDGRETAAKTDKIFLARVRLLSAQADLADMTVEEQRGDLIRATAVREHWHGMSARFVTVIDSVAAQLITAFERATGRPASPAFSAEVELQLRQAAAEVEKDGVPRSSCDLDESSAGQTNQDSKPR